MMWYICICVVSININVWDRKRVLWWHGTAHDTRTLAHSHTHTHTPAHKGIQTCIHIKHTRCIAAILTAVHYVYEVQNRIAEWSSSFFIMLYILFIVFHFVSFHEFVSFFVFFHFINEQHENILLESWNKILFRYFVILTNKKKKKIRRKFHPHWDGIHDKFWRKSTDHFFFNFYYYYFVFVKIKITFVVVFILVLFFYF